MHRTLAAAVALASVLTLLPAGAASADPKTEPLWLDCTGGLPGGWVTANGNGTWTPGLESGGTGVYVPYEFEFRLYFTPEGGEESLVGEEFFAKRAPRNKHPHGVCRFDESFPVDDPELGVGTGRFSGTARVFFTG